MGVVIGGKGAWKVKRIRGGRRPPPPPLSPPFDKKKLSRDGDEKSTRESSTSYPSRRGNEMGGRMGEGRERGEENTPFEFIRE